MSSEAKAIAAIYDLVTERDAAKGRIVYWQTKAEKAEREFDTVKRRAVLAEGERDLANRRVRELEDRVYGRTARALTSFFDVQREYVPSVMADRISIQPRSANLMLPRETVFCAQQPLAVIDEAVKRVVRMHSEELADKLRSAMWPR